jgi:cytochrome c5
MAFSGEDNMVRFVTRRSASAAVVLSLAIGWLAACQPAPPADETGQEQPPATDLIAASAAIGLPTGVAADELPDRDSDAAATYVEYCGACHGIPSPAAHSATDWPVVLRRMWFRTEGLPASYNVPVPESAERVLILNYVLDNALVVASTGLPGGPGRDLFTNTCSRCHELPDPSQHSAKDWAAVVMRMRQHMVQMLRESPPQADVQDIILYLERASQAQS